MAYDYNKTKQLYEWLNDEQKQQFAEMNKNDSTWNYQKFMQQYNAEMNNNQQSNNNSSNFNNGNGTNWQNQAYKWNPWEVDQKVENQTDSNGYSQTKNGFYTWNSEWEKEQNRKKLAEMEWNANAEIKQTDFNNVSPELDQSKFNQDPWKITVQEWTAQQTWLPDYQASSEARLNEMKGNLDHYFATSPRMFSDRETFNRVFEYNNRDSEAQRQLLDSYWKRKEDMDKASQYTSWESIMNWLKNSQITTDQLNLIKENDPEAYRKWQELQEEEIKKRIVNDIVPPLMSDIANQINDMINMLWIQAQDALDIEWIYNDTMDRTWAYQTLEDCNRTVKQIEEITNKKTAIMNRYAASTWGTVSDALAAARMQKAIAPYNEQLQGLQYQYQDYTNLFSQKSATAYQAANVRALQANENQRIWNQKTAALWFATSAMSYRTPEQQKQLDLQYQQAQNEMQLLQQSRLNDLNRYNQYATAKMQNQLQQELTDLSVEDEAQLKANLNNALSDYYKNYGDIIQRSQAQAVDDIIAYAKKKGISVAQAMTENFIKPLQNKAEYKQKVATDYGMLSQQSIGTINWRSVIMTTNPNWSISYRFIDDPYDTWIASMYTVWDTNYVKLTNGDTMTAEEYNKKYWNKVWTIKPYDMVDSKVFDTSPQSHSYYTLRDFLDDPKYQEWKRGWQCAAFVNDYLEKIWVGRYFGTEDAQTRASWCNSDTAKVWTIAVFDYNHYTDWKNYGHVWIVVDADENGFWVLDSNYDTKNPWTIQKRYVRYGSSSLKGFFDPSQPPRTSDTTSAGTSNNLSEEDKMNAEAMLKQIKTWKITPSETSEARKWLIEHWYWEQFNEALDKWLKVSLTDAQVKWWENADDDFAKEPIVKEFEWALNQLQQLQAALNDTSWVWDMSAIFTFMKTLDPTSVVRESEFNSAAATAWVLNPQAIFQSIERSVDWKFLTQQQREDFKKIAIEFIKIKAKNYQIKYDDLLKKYDAYWLDKELAPTNMADMLLESLSTPTITTWPDNVIYDIYSSSMNTNTSYSSNGWGYNNASYGGYSSDFISQMIYSKL